MKAQDIHAPTIPAVMKPYVGCEGNVALIGDSVLRSGQDVQNGCAACTISRALFWFCLRQIELKVCVSVNAAATTMKH